MEDHENKGYEDYNIDNLNSMDSDNTQVYDVSKEMEDIDTGRNDNDNKKEEKLKIKKSRKNGCMFNMVWLVLLVFISVLITRYALAGINDMLAIGRSSTIVTVEIPKNADLDTVSSILSKQGVIQEESFFKMYAFITKSRSGFSQGIYELRTDMDYEAILNYIRNQSNSKDIVEITFIEGINVQECADLLQKNEVCEKEEFLKACNSDEFDEKYEFLKAVNNKSNRYYKLEGYLFPDTYEFYRGESAQDAIKRFLNNYQKKVIKTSSSSDSSDKTSIKDRAEKNGRTIEEILCIASIIQAEAANKEDMYKVSSVIYNRLNTLSNGGKSTKGEFGLAHLKVDCTVWYPYRSKNVVPQDKVSKFVSRYNTYNIEGLPAGPICNPGLEAFDAALNPANTDYYYFCHSASGEAFYAKTNDVHESNLKKAGLK